MQDELLQFKLLNVWTLVDLPKDKWAIGTKWVFRNKKDERGIVVKNKAILVAQGHTQEEGIDHDEVFAPVARIEDIRLFLAYASFKDFVVYQMDVKSAFLYEKIEEEAPRAWPDITFVVCACARFQVTPKTSHLHAVKRIFRYLKGQPKLGLWYPKDSPFDLEAYSDSDYAGASLDRKSTTRGCQFLGKRLISCQCKKQSIVANSTTEVEYVAVASCYGQVLWIQKKILDYGFNLMNTKIYIDNKRPNPWPHLMSLFLRELVQVVVPGAKLPYWGVQKLKLEKPSESEGFEQIIDFLNSKPIRYALTVNPPVYVLCVKQFWTTAKVKKVNGQEQIQVLVDKQKYIFDNMVKHLEGGFKFLMFLRFLQVFLDKQVEGMAKHKEIYVIPSHTKKVFANIRRRGQGFSGNVTPLFETIMVNAQEEVGEGSGLHTNSHHTPTDTQPSSSKPQKKIKPKRKQRQATAVHSPSSEILVEESIPTHSNDPLPSDSLGAQEDASKHGRSIMDIDQDADIALVDEAQGRMHDANMFGVDELKGNEVIVDVKEKIVEKKVSTGDPVTTAGEVVTAASVEDSDAPTTATTNDVDDELTLVKTLIAIKAAKPKVIPTTATTVTTAITTSRAKEPKKHLKKKDQIALDEELARKLEAMMKVEMKEEKMIAKEKNKANRAIIEEWDDVQAIIDADRQLAE
nr:uncharacterized mitochondrial protein AtMg00810-like [Tanacetum cinerariifolium]